MGYLLVELATTRTFQAIGWSVGFWIVAGLVMTCGYASARRPLSQTGKARVGERGTQNREPRNRNRSRFWFNTEGFVTAAAAQPAAYQKRAFPFRIDNLRGPGYFLVNANVMRNFGIGGNRSLQFRLDVQNLFDAVLWSNPTMVPTNSNFGKVTGATNSIMRFFTFVWKVNF